MIKNNVMGKKITRTYEVKIKRDDDGFLTAKPKLDSNDSVEWVEILSFNGTNIRANNNRDYKISIGDSEKEKDIIVYKEEFRADKNEMVLYTHRAVEVIEPNKDEANANLEKLTQEYNKQEIEKDNKLISYCRLHNLVPEYTDVDELKKIVYVDSIAKHHCGGIFSSDLLFSQLGNITFHDNSQVIL